MKENLDLAKDLYKPGTWIITALGSIKEPLLVRGSVQIMDFYYGIGHQGMGVIYDGKNDVWAEIVEKPKKSTLYKL